MSGEVFVKYTVLVMLLYARNRLSGDRVESVTFQSSAGWRNVAWTKPTSPLSIVVIRRLVVLPLVWIRRVVNSYLEILCAAVEKVAVFRKLSGVRAVIIVNNEICCVVRQERLQASQYSLFTVFNVSHTCAISWFDILARSPVYFPTSRSKRRRAKGVLSVLSLVASSSSW